MPRPKKPNNPQRASVGLRLADEIGVNKDVVYYRLKQGMTYEEIRLLGAPPTGILMRVDIVRACRASGVSRDILLYRVAVMRWTLAEAEQYGNQPHPPPPPDTQTYDWGSDTKVEPPQPPRKAFVPPTNSKRAGGTSFHFKVSK